MIQNDLMRVAARPTRRTVTRAAVWTVPVVAVATTAPAFASSGCNQRNGQVLDWDGVGVIYTRTSATAARAALDPDGAGSAPTLTLDVAASYTGNMQPGSENGDTSQTMTIAPAVGGLGVSGLSLMQSTTSASPNNTNKQAVGYGDRGSYTFTFSRPVSNLDFTITDIDSTTADFRDAMVLSAGYSVVSQAGGIALTTSRDAPLEWFQAASDNVAVDNTSGSAGNLRVRFAGPISTFTITYWNIQANYDPNIDTDQRVYVSDMTFDYKPC